MDACLFMDCLQLAFVVFNNDATVSYLRERCKSCTDLGFMVVANWLHLRSNWLHLRIWYWNHHNNESRSPNYRRQEPSGEQIEARCYTIAN